MGGNKEIAHPSAEGLDDRFRRASGVAPHEHTTVGRDRPP
jgi:hypothetical protein